MSIRFHAAWNYFRVLSKLRECVALENAAVRREVLCPEEEIEAEPAIFLNGQLEKALDVPIYTTMDYEHWRVKGGRRVLDPTVAYEIRNVALMDGLFVKGHRAKWIVARDNLTVEQPDPIEMDAAALANVWTGVRFFGHWLRESCSTYVMARDFAKPLCIRTPNWTDKATYADFFDQDWTSTDRAFIDRLFFFDDLSQNSLKRQHYEALREKIRNRFTPEKPGGIVYLKRGPSAEARIVENEDVVINELAKRGVEIMEAETTPLEKILSHLLEARVVITIEGSQQEHAVFTLPLSSALITLQPPYRFNNLSKDWTQCIGMKYGFVIGDPSENGFSINIDELLQTIDLAIARESHQPTRTV